MPALCVYVVCGVGFIACFRSLVGFYLLMILGVCAGVGGLLFSGILCGFAFFRGITCFDYVIVGLLFVV